MKSFAKHKSYHEISVAPSLLDPPPKEKYIILYTLITKTNLIDINHIQILFHITC